MNIILRMIDKESKEYLKKELEKYSIFNYTDDSLFNNIIYIYNLTSVLITNNSYIIETDVNQYSIDKKLVEFMSIKNED